MAHVLHGLREAIRIPERQQVAVARYASQLWEVLTAKRWQLLKALTGAGPLSIRGIARRVDRDAKAVHADVHALLNAGILDRTEAGKIVFPYEALLFDNSRIIVTSMKTPDVISALAALAHEHRLAIFRLLVEKGPEGLPAGEIAERIGLVPSSLTFHLQHLARAGLLTQRRVGRKLFYATDFGIINELVGYLTENCCGGVGCTAAATSRSGKSRRKSARAA